jgi:hypothetical protein
MKIVLLDRLDQQNLLTFKILLIPFLGVLKPPAVNAYQSSFALEDG